MIFTFEFGSNLDFTQFKRQASHYISIFPSITYHLNLLGYKLVTEVQKKENNQYNTRFHICQIKRDSDGAVCNGTIIIPLSDLRFRELKDVISNHFTIDSHIGTSDQLDVNQVVDFHCKMVKILYKVDKLSMFA